jgi:hypothetical protein
MLLIDLLGWQQVWVSVKLMEVLESNSDRRNIQLQMKFTIGRFLLTSQPVHLRAMVHPITTPQLTHFISSAHLCTAHLYSIKLLKP